MARTPTAKPKPQTSRAYSAHTLMPWLTDCPATHPTAGQCIRPEGHNLGPHLAADSTRWDDELTGVLF